MQRETKGRGGPRPGSGRPPLPPSEKRGERVTVNLTQGERRELERAAGSEPLADVIRRVLLRWARRRRRR